MCGFFSRKPLGLDIRGRKYITAYCVNVDEMLFVPVMAGYWKQHELSDGTYTLDDLLDILEVMQVENENRHRHHESEVKQYQ